MRFPAIVAGAALLVAACGGSKSGDAPKAEAPTTAATTPAGSGATVTIEMVTTGTNAFKFVPEHVTIKAGDVVVFKGVSGLAHNVAFDKDSIPPGAAAILDAQMKDGPQALSTNMVNDGSSVTISFAGAPTGRYKIFCIPHLAMGMTASITVQ